MRVAVLADIHGNHLALQSVLADLKKRGVEQTFCLGDLVGYAPFPNEVIELVRREGIPTVMGNYDDGVGFDRLVCGCDFPDEASRLRGERSLAWTKAYTTEENKEFLRACLPPEILVEIAGKKLHMVHGSPRALNEYLYEDTPESVLQEVFHSCRGDILLVGHTHKPYHRLFQGHHLINAGSVGRPKHGDPRALYCILEIGEKLKVEFVKVSYDYQAVAGAILAAGLPAAFAELICTGKE